MHRQPEYDRTLLSVGQMIIGRKEIMRIVLFSWIAMLCLAGAAFGGNGMIVEGATEAGIRNDCRATAEMTVLLLKMRGTSTPEKMYLKALDLLDARKYQGSFGEADFVADFYTGLALQMDKEVDKFMAEASAEDQAQMAEEHEKTCLISALEELSSSPPPVQK
jgi:hypothetical protein